MFKKLKDKLAEEVKSSPARIQHFAQAAQAAVSSASSTISDTTSNSDKFFSIAEEDSPQNSPQQNYKLSTTKSNDLSAANFKNGQFPEYRKRTLSNSSMASDLSFRLPVYDVQGTSNFQSDLESASEFEDFTNATQTSQLEKLHDAYKKAIDRNSKFKEQYTDVIRRYRQLEKDNAKARTALVETQDKALRRISELREQCSLEQRAKAHLESALRLEMDDMQCVIKTLKTKLTLLESKPTEGDVNGSPTPNPDSVSLISFTEPTETNNSTPTSSSIDESLSVRIKQLEDLLNEEKCKVILCREELNGVKKKLNESQAKVKELMASEEQNTILLAENKMMIHSELEKKEVEVKNLEQKLVSSEKSLKSAVADNKNLQEINKVLKHDVDKCKDESIGQINDLKKQLADLMKTNSQLDKNKSELEMKLLQSDQNQREIESLHTRIHDKETKIAELLVEVNKMSNQNNMLTQKISDLETKFEAVSSSKDKITREYENVILQINSMNTTNDQLKGEIEQLQYAQNQSTEVDDLKQKFVALTSELDVIKEDKKNMDSKLLLVEKEKEALSTTVNTLKSKIDMIKNEKRDLEKTLEKEIREKSELKVQVTNILQEIGRLEEQLNELRFSYAKIEEEKRLLEEKTALSKGTANQDVIQSLKAQIAEIEQHRIDSVKEVSDNNLELQRHLTELQDKYESQKESSKKLHEKLAQCLDENSKLFNAKELMDHEYRSLQDQCETKEKEKLCVLDTSKCLETEMEKLRSERQEHCETIEQNQVELNQLRNEIIDLTAQIRAVTIQVKESWEKNRSLEERLEQSAELDLNLEQIRKENSSFESNLSAKEAEITRFTKINEDMKEQIRSTEQAVETVLFEKELEMSNLRKIIAGLEDQVKSLQDDLNTRLSQQEEEFNLLKQSNNDLKNESALGRKTFETSLTKSQSEIDNLKKTNDDLQTQIQLRDEALETSLSNSDLEIVKLRNTNVELEARIRMQEEELQKLSQTQVCSEPTENGNNAENISNGIAEDHSDVYEEMEEINLSNLDHEYNNRQTKQYYNSDTDYREQINSVQHEKDELEIKLNKILHEVQDVSNRNLFLEQKCENYLILEQSNERLKLQNEKLSRQLDDTLVSLHLTEGITANTEFEYLKNIMFQYLTTNISANTGTLVKVIAAVLKFTPQQTQVALERESQRHSLIGQINNLL